MDIKFSRRSLIKFGTLSAVASSLPLLNLSNKKEVKIKELDENFVAVNGWVLDKNELNNKKAHS